MTMTQEQILEAQRKANEAKQSLNHWIKRFKDNPSAFHYESLIKAMLRYQESVGAW